MKLEELASNKGYVVVNCKVYGKNGIERKLYKNKRGYLSFTIKNPSTSKNRSVHVHRLVAYQLYGKELYEEGFQVRHLDGNPLNNCEYNICLGTKSQNEMDKLPEIRRKVAIKASSKIRVLSDEMVMKVKQRRIDGASYRQLVEEFGLSGKGQAYFIVNNEYVTNK